MLRRSAAFRAYSPSLHLSYAPDRLLRLPTSLCIAQIQTFNCARWRRHCRSTTDASRAIATSAFSHFRSPPSSPHSPASLFLLPASRMATLVARRAHSTQSKGKEPERNVESHDHDHEHTHDAHSHSHSHSHTHSHGFLSSLVHRHDHGEEGHAKDPEQIVQALKGEGTSACATTIPSLTSTTLVLAPFPHTCTDPPLTKRRPR